MQVASATLVIGLEFPGPAAFLAAAPVFAEAPVKSWIRAHIFFGHVSVSFDGFPLFPAAASLGTRDHCEQQHQHDQLRKDGNFHHIGIRLDEFTTNI